MRAPSRTPIETMPVVTSTCAQPEAPWKPADLVADRAAYGEIFEFWAGDASKESANHWQKLGQMPDMTSREFMKMRDVSLKSHSAPAPRTADGTDGAL